MKNKRVTIILMGGAILALGILGGWMVEQADSRVPPPLDPVADETTRRAEVDPEGAVDSPFDEPGDAGPPGPESATGEDDQEEADTEPPLEGPELPPVEESPEETIATAEPTAAALEPADETDDDAENPDGEEEEETPLAAAERRIAELEERVALLEDDLEELFERQIAMEEAMASFVDLGEQLAEAEALRDESAAAREARAAGLERIETELNEVIESLTRGSDAVDRRLRSLDASLADLAEGASSYGQVVEAERIGAARQALDSGVRALGRRDLYETRVAVGLAAGHVRAAAALARTDLAPR